MRRAIFKSKATVRGVQYVKVTTRLPDGKRTVEVLNHGSVAASVPTKLRFQALEAEKLLAPYGVSILDAARHYVQHVKRINDSVTVTHAIQELLKARKADGVRPRYLTDLRVRLGRLEKAFGARTLATIAIAEADDWPRSLGVGPLNRKYISGQGPDALQLRT